jgi:DnaJ-domain-containing protein 1
VSNETVEQKLSALEAEVKVLKERCDNFSACHLDNHEEMRRLATRVNKYIGEVGRVGNTVASEIIASTSAQCDAVSSRAQADFQKIVSQTKAALSPEKISDAAIAAVTPGKIADELSKRVLVTRPAKRGETAGVLVTRQATPSELREHKQ